MEFADSTITMMEANVTDTPITIRTVTGKRVYMYAW